MSACCFAVKASLKESPSFVASCFTAEAVAAVFAQNGWTWAVTSKGGVPTAADIRQFVQNSVEEVRHGGLSMLCSGRIATAKHRGSILVFLDYDLCAHETFSDEDLHYSIDALDKVFDAAVPIGCFVDARPLDTVQEALDFACESGHIRKTERRSAMEWIDSLLRGKT